MTNLTLGKAVGERAFRRTVFPSTFVGFDRILNDLERFTHNSSNTYPPYNIVKTGEDRYTIELAVAGFSRDELTIELNNQDLTITGEKNSTERDYLHKGISAKKFTRSFRLSENVIVGGADFVDGMLVVNLEHIVPEDKRPRTIPIGYDAKQDLLLEEEVA